MGYPEYQESERYFSGSDLFAIDASQSERTAFIQRTYAHLGGALLLFIGLTTAFLNIALIRDPMVGLLESGHYIWILLAFVAASWGAHAMAASGSSPAVQYAGLILYALFEAIIFIPLLYLAQVQTGSSDIIFQAGFLSLLIFGGLTAFVFLTKADFSFLGPFLFIASIAALGFIICGAFMGFSLGLFFVCAMIIMMSGYILYDTSNVLHHYQTDQHVAASLALFSSLATLFWYVLRLAMIFADE